MSAHLSERAVCALGVFGLTRDDLRDESLSRTSHAKAAAEQLDRDLAPGRIALLTGPSGSGKSTLLRELRDRLRTRGDEAIDAWQLLASAERRGGSGGVSPRVVDVLARTPSAVPAALCTLSAAGLADAHIPLRRIHELSDGQRARLAIALAMAAVGESRNAAENRTSTILIDELAGTLDDACAEGLCITLRRWVRSRKGVRIVAASAREQVVHWLAPDLLLGSPTQGGPALQAEHNSPDPQITITPGTLADYHHLAHLHYRAAAPATCVRVLTAIAQSIAQVIGVLVISNPTLNGAWRSLAWPGQYAAPNMTKRESAARLNKDVRCISRLIVDPRFRARGVGQALIRAYLAEPLTPRTEAVSAMGAACPVFTRAGMHEWLPAPPRRDTRLIHNIEAAGLHTWMIADIDEAMRAIARHQHLEPAFRTWARAHGPTRHLAGADVRHIVRAAAKSVIVRPRAYTTG